MRRHPEELAVRRKTDRTPTTSNWRSQMTLIKSLLLGSAAGVVAVATAQAADLPTRKAAPVEYVRVCNVGGITGWTLPGSDTCVKFSGYMTAQVTGGNLSTQYNWGTVGDAIGAAAVTPGLGALAASPALAALGGIDPRNTQRVLLAASSNSAEYELLPQRDRLVEPGQLRVRYGLQHGLGPSHRPYGLQRGRVEWIRPASVQWRRRRQHRLSEHRLSDLGGHHRR